MRILQSECVVHVSIMSEEKEKQRVLTKTKFKGVQQKEKKIDAEDRKNRRYSNT